MVMRDHVKSMPSIFFCLWYQHGRVILWHTFLNSPCYVRLITPWTQPPQLLSSISSPLPQSNAPSYQGILPLWCQLTTHLQWLKPSLEPSTQVSVNIALMRWQISYSDVFLQLVNTLDKLVVKIYLHIMGTWKIGCGCFRPHGNEGVAKCGIISKCKQLQVHY